MAVETGHPPVPHAPVLAAPEDPDWPAIPGASRVVFLLDVASRFEENLLRHWILQADPGPPAGDGRAEILRIPCSRRARGGVDPRLEATLAAGDDPLLAPLRVAWFPEVRDGRRTARWSDLLKLGDPRDPSRLRARWVHAFGTDRWRIVAGEPALASELKARWRSPPGSAGS